MSKNPSVTKRIQIALRNRKRNKIYKSSIKTLIKKTIRSIDEDHLSAVDVRMCLAKAYSRIDKAVKKGVIHKNQGARKKSKLFIQYKKSDV